jgi:glutamate formiminotransferase
MARPADRQHQIIFCQSIPMAEHASASENRLECVINISEGRHSEVLQELARSLDPQDLLDVHIDPWHHRSVWTLIGTQAPRRLTQRAVELLDIGDHHHGVHPRLGVVDVVPFVPLGQTTMSQAIVARNEFAQWLSQEMNVPCFLYGPNIGSDHDFRSLPEIRRSAWKELRPDWGPRYPHPSAGSVCVGARQILVAFNIWLQPGSDWSRATEITRAIRSPEVRALTLRVGSHIQISMNLIEPFVIGPAEIYEQVHSLVVERQMFIERSELVGLIPDAVLSAIPESNWAELDLSRDRTIEHRLVSGFQLATG